MDQIPRATSNVALLSASMLRVIRKDGSGWPVMRREPGRPLNLLRSSVMTGLRRSVMEGWTLRTGYQPPLPLSRFPCTSVAQREAHD